MEKTPNWETEELSQKNWLVSLKKNYCRQPIAILAACAAMIIVAELLKYAWIVPVVVEQKQRETLHDRVFKEFNQLEEILNNTATQISELKDRDMQLTARITQLEQDNVQQKGKISELEEAEGEQKVRITQLEQDNVQQKAKISELEEAEGEQKVRITQLEEDNVQQRANISELEEADGRQRDRITKLEAANEQHRATISELQLQLAQLEREARQLEASKANQDEVDLLTNSIAELNESKVDTDEFNDLADNVSLLASTKADRTTAMELEKGFIDFAETALNQTHFIAMKVTVLEGDIEQIDTTLDTKADQQDVNKNTNTITTLRETTVRKEDFQELATTVGSKADQSDLDDLKDTVTHLRQTAATKSELNSLSGRVTNHITSSQNRLTSRIDVNDQDIQSLKDRIGNVESDNDQNNEYRSNTVEDELDSGGLAPLPSSWMITAMTIIIRALYIYM